MGHPVASAGLTAKRVMVKKTLCQRLGRPLTDLRRWPGDEFFGQNSEVGVPTSVGESDRGRAKLEFRPRVARARQAGSDAGHMTV